MISGCGTVGRAVASHTRVPSSNQPSAIFTYIKKQADNRLIKNNKQEIV